MPIAYRFNKAINLLHTTLSGEVTQKEVVEFYDEIEAIDRGLVGLRELIDFVPMTSAAMPAAKIDGLIALIDGIYSRNDVLPRVACLAPNAPGADIAARFVAAMQNREPQIAAVHVSDLDAALGFLGIPEASWPLVTRNKAP